MLSAEKLSFVLDDIRRLGFGLSRVRGLKSEEERSSAWERQEGAPNTNTKEAKKEALIGSCARHRFHRDSSRLLACSPCNKLSDSLKCMRCACLLVIVRDSREGKEKKRNTCRRSLRLLGPHRTPNPIYYLYASDMEY